MAGRNELHTDSAWSTPERIVVKGFDLCEDLIGKASLTDLAFLELTDRLPDPDEAAVFNAIAITLVEHGITPSALVTRLTYSGAPEAMQAAVAAGLSGLGSVFVGSMEGAARLLQEALSARPDDDPQSIAEAIVERELWRKARIPGIGHHFHKPADPRTRRLFQVAAEHGHRGCHVALMEQIARTAERRSGRALPVNATGAIAALAGELGIDWRVVRGIGVMARAIGLVGHIREEIARPMAREIKTRVEEEATAHFRDR